MKRKILFGAFFLVFLVGGIVAVRYVVQEKKNAEIYEELQKEDKTEPALKADDTPMVETPKVEIPIDFAALQSTNPDIYAWIEIPGTEVNYPILQSADDQSYYLDHTVEKNAGLPGSIYTENLNRKDFQDPNTLIYGHDMRDGSMFGNLKKYVDSTYMEEHSTIYIYTPEHKFTYEVFGAVTYDDRHILNSFDFADQTQYQAYLDSIYSVRNMNTYLKEGVSVTPADRIITLSTCTGNESQRLLVEAVLRSEE